jgi:hypothetical protein
MVEREEGAGPQEDVEATVAGRGREQRGEGESDGERMGVRAKGTGIFWLYRSGFDHRSPNDLGRPKTRAIVGGEIEIFPMSIERQPNSCRFMLL